MEFFDTEQKEATGKIRSAERYTDWPVKWVKVTNLIFSPFLCHNMFMAAQHHSQSFSDGSGTDATKAIFFSAIFSRGWQIRTKRQWCQAMPGLRVALSKHLRAPFALLPESKGNGYSEPGKDDVH